MNVSGPKKLNYAIYVLLGLITISCIQEPVENGLGGYLSEQEYQEEFMSNGDTDLILDEASGMDTVQIDTSFIDFSNEMIDLLATNELIKFSEHFHPIKGCAFLPYTFLTDETQKFTTSTFGAQLELNEKLMWGSQDGSGDSIVYTVANYIKAYVYDFDYKNKSSDFHFNSDLAFSNTQNNISDAFPDADFMEFYYDGTIEYEGMDWKSLIFYVEKLDNTYYLVAVVHNQWTI